jgi:hypothetical protein
VTKKRTARLRIRKVPLIVVNQDQLKPALKPLVEPVVAKLDRHDTLLLELKAAIAKLHAQVKHLRATRRRS